MNIYHMAMLISIAVIILILIGCLTLRLCLEYRYGYYNGNRRISRIENPMRQQEIEMPERSSASIDIVVN